MAFKCRTISSEGVRCCELAFVDVFRCGGNACRLELCAVAGCGRVARFMGVWSFVAVERSKSMVKLDISTTSRSDVLIAIDNLPSS